MTEKGIIMNKEITLLIATKNKHKVTEIESILKEFASYEENTGLPAIKLLTLADVNFNGEIIEDGSTFEENARIKARAAAALGYIGVADDSGICANGLGGAPGIYSARYSGGSDDDNNQKLLRELADKSDRTAYYYCAVACEFPNGRKGFVASGRCNGCIINEYRGNGGFGYDPIFRSDDLGKTFGEATAEEKHGVSHRGRAVREFARELYKILREEKEI